MYFLSYCVPTLSCLENPSGQLSGRFFLMFNMVIRGESMAGNEVNRLLVMNDKTKQKRHILNYGETLQMHKTEEAANCEHIKPV